MTKTVKKEQAKFKSRGYRFSKKTQNLLNKLTKRTKKSQNDVVRKALEGYEERLNIEMMEYNKSIGSGVVMDPLWVKNQNEHVQVSDPVLNNTMDRLIDSEGNYSKN